MRVLVPSDVDIARYLGFGRDLFELPSSDAYEFDFGQVSFVSPGWLLSVGSALRDFRAHRPGAKRKATNYKHLGYAAHVGFFKFFGLTYGLAPAQAGGSDTYVPIREQDVAALKASAAERRMHPGEVVEEEARRLATLLTREEQGPLVDTLTYSLREIVRNVVEHSDSETYSVAAQYWPQSGAAELAVVDRGCGILQSLKENPKLSVSSDLDALKLAVLPGISSKAWRRGRSDDAWANSGYGLFMTQRLASRGGRFTLVSGDSGVAIEGSALTEIKSHSPGTLVVLRLRTTALRDLTEQLSTFRQEGREIAKKVGGADRLGPSLASQLLQPASHKGG